MKRNTKSINTLAVLHRHSAFYFVHSNSTSWVCFNPSSSSSYYYYIRVITEPQFFQIFGLIYRVSPTVREMTKFQSCRSAQFSSLILSLLLLFTSGMSIYLNPILTVLFIRAKIRHPLSIETFLSNT